MSVHDIKVGMMLASDDQEKPFVAFSNPRSAGNFIARAYRKTNKWVLVSDPTYDGGGLIVVINNYTGDKDPPKLDSYIDVTKILPNVVIGDIT